ncbi:hypothetical protein [Paenimyroides viscosum]|uniref:HNH nuclease domain-containing protein n=1 Tax=Paenimyroides viscosum TaxID=2488729 RepID=A0A3P1B5T6_9FLAO|nr:hypothetical protein [Paenimyroides viscosum]RRA96510.1 hypothetical protein EG242_02630 [Paenimyroides viscosum]
MGLPVIKFDKKEIDLYSKTNFDFDKIKNLKRFNDVNYQKYLRYLSLNIKSILTCSVDDLDKIAKNFKKIIDFKNKLKCTNRIGRKNCSNCSNCKKNILDNEFVSKIQEVLKYSSNSLSPYFKGRTNSACYICNAQYTIFANNSKGSKLIFEFDHYYPKSLFPGLSVSLYNLIPICGSCNKFKGNREYDIKRMHSNLKFELDNLSLGNYLTKGLKLSIKINDVTNISKKFYLSEIYEHHTDYIEELIQRKIKYNNAYKSKLEKKFGRIVGNFSAIENRLELGTYTSNEGIYKRPLSKFLQDINDQLNSL